MGKIIIDTMMISSTLSQGDSSSSHASHCRDSALLSRNTSDSFTATQLASEAPAKSQKLHWRGLVALLRNEPDSLAALLAHFDLLSVSPARFARARQVSARFRALVADFGTQNCIRAVSLIVDCSQVKKNQYKWMFEGLTLGAAIDSLIREARYLFRSLGRHDTDPRHFFRLLANWIDYLMEVHSTPKDAEAQLRPLIVERVRIFLDLTLG